MPRLRAGQPPLIPSASAWNRHEDAANWYHRNKALGEGGGTLLYIPPTDVVVVKNSTGADRRRGDVVEVIDHLLDKIDPENLWLTATTPNGARPFGILREPLVGSPPSQGPCQMSGVCQAWLNVTDVNHTHAKVDSGSFVLQSAESGPVEIIDKESAGTGEKAAIVRFFPSAQSLAIATAQLTQNMCGTLDEVIGIDNFVLQAGIMPGATPTTAINHFGRQGKDNARVELHFYNKALNGDANPHWVIAIPQMRKADHVQQVRFDDYTLCLLEDYYADAALESCQDLQTREVKCADPCVAEEA